MSTKPYFPPQILLPLLMKYEQNSNTPIVSTTLALLDSPKYAQTKITLLDPALPSAGQENIHPPPYAASTDSSRIIRPDYASPAYSALAAEAQEIWRRDYTANGIYHETGLAVVADGINEDGAAYVRKSKENVSTSSETTRGARIEGLDSREEITRILKGAGGGSGESGYVNWGSGWADAASAMRVVMDKLLAYGKRVDMVRGKAERLVFEENTGEKRKVVGVGLEGGREVSAKVTILAAGAWSGSLVDLKGIAEARGQVVAYVRLSTPERRRLANMPILLNLGTGMFVIPPPLSLPASDEQGGILKVARHGFGYRNPVCAPALGGVQVSLPSPNSSVLPTEGRQACRTFLSQVLPWLSTRPFCEERICWYTDTPTGDFLIDWHPGFAGLFLATGGSGHGFKFLPVLGECVIAILEGDEARTGQMGELGKLWGWRERLGVEKVETQDGSRSGKRGMVLAEEMARGASRL